MTEHTAPHASQRAGLESGAWRGRQVVVTGADGFLGSVLCRDLVALGARVRAGVGPTRRHHLLAALGLEMVDVDIRDQGQVERLFATAEPPVVFHCAGLVTLDSRLTRDLWQTNVLGTRHVVAAARAAGVRRLVFVSSVHALRPDAGGVTREPPRLDPALFDPDTLVGGYAQSKSAATRAIAEADDQDCVTLFPTGFGGPGDPGPGPVNRVIKDLATGRLSIVVSGGNAFSDIRDVSQAVIRAAEVGGRGEGYVLNGEWVTISDIATRVTSMVGLRRPTMLPLALAYAGLPMAAVRARRHRVPASLTAYSLHTLRHPVRTSHAKAAAELDYRPRPIADTIDDVLAEIRPPRA